MKTVKFLCNYREDINEWESKYFLDNYHKIKIDKENPDYYVIINHPFYKGKKQEYDNKRTVYFHNEPISTRNKWDNWKSKETFLFDNTNNIKNWHLDMTANELLTVPIYKDEKLRRNITCVSTDLYDLPGHKARVNFLRYFDLLPQVNITGEIYGREVTKLYTQMNIKSYKGETDKRDDVLLKYYYHFMVENSQEKNYFTEKILDPILSETLCFYWGCPNIKNYLHEKSYIQVDITRPKLALQTIIDSINNNEYDKRLKYIKESKKKIIYELNPITILQNCLMETI